MMMPVPHTTTPPPTGDEGSLPMGSPSMKSVNSDLAWSSPRGRCNPRLKSKQARRKQNRKELSECAFKLEGPISVLTERFHGTPIRDMDAWVGRSAVIRQEEVRSRNGKISRPMNSFMLYRSAYAERTKKLVGANNHQIVSKIAGLGWKLEPVEIRRKYEELAKLERDNHAATHPNYKFSPNKTINPSNRRDSGSPSEVPAHLGEEAGFSDLDSEFGGSIASGPRPPYGNHSRSHSFEDPYYDTSRDSSPFGVYESMVPGYMHSPWTNTSHPAGLPSGMGSQVEDMRFRSTSPTHHDITYDSSLAGIPGVAHYDLLQQPTQPSSDMDPRLLSQSSDVVAMDGSYPHPYSTWNDGAMHGHYPAASAPSMSPSPAPYAHSDMGSTFLPNMHMESRDPILDIPRPAEGMSEALAGEFATWYVEEASGSY
jgi:hypothetical protein